VLSISLMDVDINMQK